MRPYEIKIKLQTLLLNGQPSQMGCTGRSEHQGLGTKGFQKGMGRAGWLSAGPWSWGKVGEGCWAREGVRSTGWVFKYLHLLPCRPQLYSEEEAFHLFDSKILVCTKKSLQTFSVFLEKELKQATLEN